MNPFGAERLAAKKVGKVGSDEIKEFGVYPTDLWFSNYTQWSCEYFLESTGESSGHRERVSPPCFNHISSDFVRLMVDIDDKLFYLKQRVPRLSKV